MNILITFVLATMVGLTSYSQPQQPVGWTVSVENIGGTVFEAVATGRMSSPDWHIYDLRRYEGGPNSTAFTLSGEGISPIGEARICSEVSRNFDETFGMEIGTCSGPVEIRQRFEAEKGASVTVSIEWQACNDDSCLPPDEFSQTLRVGAETEPTNTGKSLWSLILEAIAWGFVALLTPCVFPMVPMTVSFFLKQEGGRSRGKWLAAIFGLSIVILYTVPIAVIILATYITGGAAVTADIFNWLATHWIPNLLFFIIFMLFAASFFGAFEITMPGSLVNRSDEKSNRGGLGGVFFVALTLVLVSFSCTGPIVGSVLIKSTRGEFWEPIITMLAFSIAFALPFTILAFAPSLLKKLPKSGSWLNSVKVVLGFVEVALGFKFLSVADQTYHWGILDREVYLAIWIVVFSLLGLYLLGRIRFKYDSEVKHLSVFRLILVIIDFSFVVYMIPGMWGAPLKALSGYLPPITTQDFVLGAGRASVPEVVSPGQGGRKYADFLELPYGIPAFFDYDEARTYAIENGKPLFIDFTGHGCVNCREMESRVWSDPEALKMLREDYVVCALYADDKTVLDRKDWITAEDGTVLKTLGKVNSHFALTRFNVNAQPYYAILDPTTGEKKVPSRGYDLNVSHFIEFLKSGLK